MSVKYKDENGVLQNGAGLYKVTAPIGMADIYSTEEKEVGLWCNGKPLYQKTINLQSIDITASSSGMYYYAMTTANYISNAELILGKTEMSYVITNGETRVFEDIEQQGALTVLWSKISRPSVDAVITLQYTKTTDVAGSGEYVPSGDKAVHYSTEEQVIGTWLGETLYRRTFYVNTNLASPSVWYSTGVDISYISRIVSYSSNSGSAIWNAVSPINNAGTLSLVNLGTGNNLSVEYVTLEYTKTSS